MKKYPHGVFFRIRLDSLNMNDTEFSFSGLIKLNIERPILGMNPSSLRFVKHMSLDLSSEKLYRVFFTVFELIKPKIGTHRSWWGKWEGNHFVNNGSCLLLPLNMALVYTSCQSIGYLADLRDNPLSWVMSLLWVFQKNALSTVALCVCLVQSCCQVFLSCRPMFKGDLKKF